MGYISLAVKSSRMFALQGRKNITINGSISNKNEKFTIFVDTREPDGITEAKKSTITISLPSGEIWSGTAEQLENALLKKRYLRK